MNQSHILFSVASELFVSVITLQANQEIRAPFLGKSKEAFLFQALSLPHSCGVQSVWSQLLSLPFFLLSLFLKLFSLSLSPMVWVCVWLVFLGTRPSWVPALFVVCTDSILRLASDTQWSAFPGIGDLNYIPLNWVRRQQMQEYQDFIRLCSQRRKLQYFR